MNNLSDIVAKKHRVSKSGVKAKKKDATKKKKLGLSTERHNPRAFSVANVVRTKRTQQRNLDRLQQKEVVPLVNRADELPPPVFIVIMGPKDVGKSTLIRSLVKIYTGQNLTDTKGPITCVAGRKRRITIFECPLDMYSMTDLAKVADLVLLMVDASYGFEMETFEYLNMLQLHGFPKVVGVMTHLDKFKLSKSLQNTKKLIKHRFWTEIYKGAKMFELSGVVNGKYLKHEIKRLSLYLQRVKFRPLVWRNTHPYTVVDRVEDVTPMSKISQDNNCDRDVALFGYVRGTHLKESMKMHLIGAGDFDIAAINFLSDPCPLPGGTESTSNGKVVKKVSLKAKDTLLYAPMANVGRVQISDRDGVFIELKDIHYTKRENLAVIDQKIHNRGGDGSDDEDDDDDDEATGAGNELYGDKIARDTPMGLLRNMQDVRRGVDELIQDSEMTLFPHSRPIKSSQMHDVADPLPATTKQQRFHTLPDYDDDEEADNNNDDDDDDEEEEEEDDDDDDDEEEDDDDEDDDDENDDDDDEDNDIDEEDEDEDEENIAEAFAKRRLNNNTDVSRNGADTLRKKATTEFLTRLQEQDGRDIMRRIYGDLARGNQTSSGTHVSTEEFADDDDDDDPADDLFVVKSSTSKHDKYAKVNARDTSRNLQTIADVISKWNTSLDLVESSAKSADTVRNFALLKERCVTGSWGGKNVSNRVKGKSTDDDGDDEGDGINDEEIYGDFEDLETGESFGGSRSHKSRPRSAKVSDDDDDADNAKEDYDFDYENEDGDDEDEYEDADANDDQYDDQYDDNGDDDEDESEGINLSENRQRANMSAEDLDAHNDDIDRQLRELNAKKKLTSKSKFDYDYDTRQDGDGGEDGDDVGDGMTKGKNGKKKHLTEQEEEEQKLFDIAKKLQQDQRDRTKAEFGDDGDLMRVRHEGYRQGMYVRILLQGVPVEFTRNFRPQLPVILGGLLPHESTMGFFRVRVKRHRWYQKILKSNDPIIFSVGWRRYQSLPVFTMEDQNQRERFLKYTPEHMHCACVIYGPLVPPNTGVMAYQKASNRVSGFRICLTGTVLEHQATPMIMKKLKLVGTPTKIFKNTAFLTGMFNSALEVAKFEGVKLKTVSGIRGQIKKALKEGQPGSFRATFEDKILISDIVICRLWVPVDLNKFCNPVMSLLTDATTKVDEWQGMRSQAQIRKDEQIPISYNKDSLYKPVERVQRQFGKVNVSRKLEESLPFASKSKLEKVKNPSSYLARRAVVLESEDRKKRGLVHMVSSIAKDKIEKRKLAKDVKTKKNAKIKERETERFADVHKEERKKRYRDEGKESMRREKKQIRRAEAQDD